MPSLTSLAAIYTSFYLPRHLHLITLRDHITHGRLGIELCSWISGSNPTSVLISCVTISYVTKNDILFFSDYKTGAAVIVLTSLGCWEDKGRIK